MRMRDAMYVVAPAVAILLLTSCGGSTTTSTIPVDGQQGRHGTKHQTSSCPCLYAANLNAPDGGSVTVYPSGATGNVKPAQNISGNYSNIFDPRDVAVDGNGNIYVVEEGGAGPGTINVYAPGTTGNVAPLRTISGSNTLMEGSNGIGINPINGDIYVANGADVEGGTYGVLIFPSDANGNVAPSGVISGSNTGLSDPSGVVLDASGNIYVSNYGSSAAVTIYAAGSTGDAAPIRTIKGGLTKLNAPQGLALDSSANIYVANENKSVTVYASGASGNVAPIQLIKGSATKLKDTSGVAVDSSDNVYVSNGAGLGGVSDSFINVYASGATGNVAPIRILKGAKTGLGGPDGITIQ